MKNFLGIVVCENFVEEIKIAMKNSNIENVIISSFKSQCGCNNKKDNTLIQAISRCEGKCSKILIFGGSCCANLDKFYEMERYKIQTFEYCFQILVNKDIIEYFIREKSYIVSPGWLKNWRKNIEEMDFDKESAELFFRDFATKITLLNTGIYENSLNKLQEFGEFVKLPYDYIPVGLDFTSMLIEKNILEWKLEVTKREKIDIIAKENVQLADKAMFFELLSELAHVMTETEAIKNVINLFNLFYAPRHSVYIPVNKDNFVECNSELAISDEECIWDDTKNGFVLKIAYKNEVLGLIKVYKVAYPNKKDYYMNLAIIIGRVCGLTIANSRKYERQKITEQLLSKEKEKVLYILNNIHEGVFIINSNKKIIFINNSVGKLLKIDKNNSILGKSVFDFIHSDYQEIALKRLNKVLFNKATVPLIEEQFIKSNGNTISVEVSSGAFEYEGNWCVLSVIRDISERKRAEKLNSQFVEQSKLLDEALEYDKLKTEFLANLSHELRTPLNVLFSTLQLLNLGGINTSTSDNEEKVKKYYNIMRQNCYRLLRLVNNLIDITKIDAGFYKLNFKNQNIINIIEDITLSVVEYGNNKGIEIIFDTDIEEKIMACDADKIERIILNLLSNAIKFTPSNGKIVVSIKDNETSILISVKDTGIGIPLDMQKCIFDRFVQVDKSLSRNKEGSGIGLSLVKSLVELHGGTIWIVSEYNSGSEFLFELPVQVLEDDEYIVPDNDIANENNIQRINIEFSDIYD